MSRLISTIAKKNKHGFNTMPVSNIEGNIIRLEDADITYQLQKT